jgi:hypothetical protein
MCKRVQANPTHRPRVTLSKEARAALTVRRRDNSRRFKSALQDAWNGLDETVKTIASSHHKSFRRVQNDLCIGRGMMRFKRYGEYKETQTSGVRISTKSKIIDVTQTLKAIESEVSPRCVLFFLADIVYS